MSLPEDPEDGPVGAGGDARVVDASAKVSASKSIVLFSDGTGNSSAQLFKTNVWRTYEAVDLGPAAPGKQKQIAFYDDGVGTSALRPLAILGGMFGFGLKRNVLEIYRFACRNYDPAAGNGATGGGDEIYGFGFSRGAFTMRLVIALIASQGLVPSTSEAELLRRSEDAYREFRRDFLPRRFEAPTRAFRFLRDLLVARRRGKQGVRPYSSADNHHPVIRFVGVWDTVAAYGGPIVEIIRAIDDWFYALSMPDYQLNERVLRARHALALDDERDAFQPLVWDELHEAELVRNEVVGPDRLQQVWFTGMHADVGGGYPDESLSYVSLLWMLEEAQDAGLRTLDVITDRFRALANSSGPIHDSRSGFGVYYRYQPRRLAALLDPPSPESMVNWDPALASLDGRPRGLLRGVSIHESVAARIATGTDRYAPITIPECFEIVPPQREGETAPQADSEGAGERPVADAPITMISPTVHDALVDPGRARAREAAMRRVWDLVWQRRVTYFASLACTLVLVLLPLIRSKTAFELLCADDRCVLPGLFGRAAAFLPGFARPWIDAFATHPYLTIALGLLLVVLMARSSAIEAALRASSLEAWNINLGRPSSAASDRGSLVRSIRTSRAYQAIFHGAKWHALPALLAVLLFATGVWLIGAVGTQVWLVFAERNGVLCAPAAGRRAGASVAFSTAAPCTDLRARVVAGARYEILLRPDKPWSDSGHEASPELGVLNELPWYTAPLGLYRRVVGAGWLKPLAAIRRTAELKRGDIGPAFRLEAIDFRPVEGGGYRAELEARSSGELYLAVNDAVLPFAPGLFYANNGGTALVEVRQLTAAPLQRAR